MAVNMFNKYLTLIVFTSCFGVLYAHINTRYIINIIYNIIKRRRMMRKIIQKCGRQGYYII